MPELGIYLLALAGVALAFARSPKVAFGALVAYWLLIPASLIVPHGPHILLVNRVVLYAFAARLIWRRGRPGEPDGASYRFTPIHFALLGLLLVGYVDGVLLAQPGVSLASDLDTWIYTLDMAVVFVVTLAILRTLGVWPVIRTIVVVTTATAVIAVFERLTGSGWSHLLFEHIPANYLAPGSSPLASRGGHVRPQVAAQFALEYGWVLVMLLPIVVVVALRWAGKGTRFSRLAYLLPIAVAVAVALTASRSAEVGVAGVAVLLLVASGAPRRLTAALGIGAAGALFVSLVAPSLVGSPFRAAAHTTSISVRLQRLPNLFALAVHHPFTGLGYSGLFGSLPGVDDAYALLYATVGVLGLTAWLIMLVTSGTTAARTLRANRYSEVRDLGAACLVGLVAAAVAGAAYDIVTTPQSEWAVMILAAVGAALADRVRRRVPERRLWALRAVLPLLGVGAGAMVLLVAPSGSSESVGMFLGSPRVIATNSGPVDDYTGKILVNTFCGFLDSPDQILPGSTLSCQRLTDIEPGVWPTFALIRIGGPNPATVRNEYQRAVGRYAPYIPGEVAYVGTLSTGKPAWASTAPMWGGLAGLMLMLLVPPLSRRRRRAQHSSRGSRASPIPEVPAFDGDCSQIPSFDVPVSIG